MRVAVVGSRSFNDYKLLCDVVSKYDISLIISGGAKGADTLAERYADERQIKKEIILPNYDKYGRGAPLIRNKEIVNKADFVIAFWDGKSRGTKFVIDYCKTVNKRYEVIYYQ